MKMRTIPEAARELGLSESFVRRGVDAGKWKIFQAGRRALVDVDEVAQSKSPSRPGADIPEISRQTGLSHNRIRHGIRDGWIPHWVEGKKYLMDPDEVSRAIQDRMTKK